MITITLDRSRYRERDIEDWLYDNPGAISMAGEPVASWIGRQVVVPSGIVDLVGAVGGSAWGQRYSCLVVVEVKNVSISSGAISQVCRYAADIEEMIDVPNNDWYIQPGTPVYKMVVGPSISGRVNRSAGRHNVNVCQFSVSINQGGKKRRIIPSLGELLGR